MSRIMKAAGLVMCLSCVAYGCGGDEDRVVPPGGADNAAGGSAGAAAPSDDEHGHDHGSAAGSGVTEQPVASKPDAGSAPPDKGAVSASVALSPTAELPLCADAEKWATGTGSVSISADDKTISVELTHYNLSGEPTDAHIHAGGPTDMGPVVLKFAGPFTSPIRKTFSAADYVAAKNAPTDFAAFVKSMKAGQSYLNIHSKACATGEIRGQIAFEPAAASGKIVGFSTTLRPADELPLCAAGGESAIGVGAVAISADGKQLAVAIRHAGLSGAPTHAHVHAGGPTDMGPVVLDLGDDLGSPISRTFTASDYVAAKNAPPDFAAFLSSLKAGKAYLNVHTEACMTGEIRGQLVNPVFRADLAPAKELPLCDKGSASAAGAGVAVVSDDGSQLEVQLAHAGLSGAPIHAHIHAGGPTDMGPVVLDFGDDLSSPIRRTFKAADYKPGNNAAPDFASFLGDLKAGKAYFNIHTDACQSGEIRGQIE